MSIDSVKDALPDFAKDLKLNLSSLTRLSSLTPQQLWGTIVACAAASRDQGLLAELLDDAQAHLSEEALNAACAAASIMAMNNVAYRARHFLEGSYDDLRLGLRMNVIGNPGVDKVDFELWALAVSTINGCQACVQSHEQELRSAGMERAPILDGMRIAAIISGVAQARMIAAVR